MALPQMFIIGAPKAGTTALHSALATHPRLFMSTPKEPKYYLCGDEPPRRQSGPGDAHSGREWVWQRDRYKALFAEAPLNTLRGESTPFYLWSEDAQRRIARELPHAKLIAVLRDPIDRAYSNWTHLWSDGLEPVGDFITACRLEKRRAKAGWAPFWRYLELGRYGEQLQRLHQWFPAEQIHVLRYRDLVDEPHRALTDIAKFLSVSDDGFGTVPSENVSTWVPPSPVSSALQAAVRGGAWVGGYTPPAWWRSASRPLLKALRGRRQDRPDLAPQQRAELLPHFAEDNDLLNQVTGMDFSDWRGQDGRGAYSVRRSWAPSDRVAS